MQYPFCANNTKGVCFYKKSVYIKKMSDNNSKKIIWKQPWHFPESILIVLGLYATGILLQLTAGIFNFTNLAWPVNIVIGLLSVVAVFLISLRKNSLFFQWLAGAPLSISFIAILLIQTMIMGFTPQIQGKLTTIPDFFDLVGFTRMTSSWPFVLTYLGALMALSAAIINRLRKPVWSAYAFYLNHIGLYVFLFSAGFGASDLRRYVMYVEEKAEYPEWRVYNDKKEVLELPLAITLNDFVMEEYEPKLAIIDIKTGDAQPQTAPEYYQIDMRNPKSVINGWELQVDTFYAQAVRNSGFTYRPIDMPGSAPAAYIRLRNLTTNEQIRGWVCSGNFAQLYMPLSINEQYSLVMTRPEPKRYASDVEVINSKGNIKNAIVEVNKPLRIGSWTIYQHGYDEEAGRASEYSSFELVYDPWIWGVYAGIIMSAIGSVSLFWIGNKKRKEAKK